MICKPTDKFLLECTLPLDTDCFVTKKNVGMEMPNHKDVLNIDQTLTVFNCSLAPETKHVFGRTHSKDFDSLETRPFPLDNPDFSITFLSSIIKP